jgi:serine protease Do
MHAMKLTRTFTVGLFAALSAAPVAARAQNQQSKGWVGIVITSGIGQTDRVGSMVFSDYPVIESIEPGSPAERAGLMTGDIVMSINSQDLRKNPVPPPAMLEPGQKVTFRFKRNDTMKTATILVEPRPEGNPQTFRLSIIGPVPGPERERADVGATQRVMIRRPMVEINPLATPTAVPSIVIAGALMTQLSEDMREAMSVKGNGVFVINVRTDSPAGEAGLKGGDVILKADRQAVDNPGELLRIMRANAEIAAVRLELIRKKQPRVITLRW